MHTGAGFVGGFRTHFVPAVTTVPPRGYPPSLSMSLYLVILLPEQKDLALYQPMP
jgi:hypothetical protein